MRSLRLALSLPLGLLALTLLAPERAAAQLCDRPGYTREASCPNEARDATGCCPAPPRRAPPAPSVTPPPADEPCPKTQVRTASGRCCWPGQRGTANGCTGRPRSCPLGWEANASGCLPAGTRARAMVLIPPVSFYGAAFVIDRTPVTVQAYRACVADGACEWREPEHLCNHAQHRTHPMNCVSSAGAEAYCRWAGGLRLPTGAEWERAAGADDGRRYPWGDAIPDDRRAHWGQVCARPPCTAPVGRRPQGASPYGVLDLAGNIWERTADGDARGGNWSGSERELRIEAEVRPQEAAQVGFRCVGDLVWDYVEALGESESPVAQRTLEAAFVELALARRDLGAGAYTEAANRFEAASAALAEAGHSRAFVFRYHAAGAFAQAGADEAAAASLAAYFGAGGAYPPPFDAPPIGQTLQLVSQDYVEALGESESPAAREALEAAFVELALARRDLRAGAHTEAAARFEATSAALAEAGHRRAFVFRYHAAGALAQAGSHEAAVAHLVAYFGAGGAYPPASSAPRIERALRLAGWEQAQPRWAQRDGFRETLGEPPPSLSPEDFEVVLWDLVEAAMESALGRHLDAAAKYEGAAFRLHQADHAGAGRLWAYAAATLERDEELVRARQRYVFYLDAGGDDPPTLEGVTLSDALGREARTDYAGWRGHERFRYGQRALFSRAYADARGAFERSYTEFEGHPRQAEATVWLAHAHEREGDVAGARLRYFAAARLAPAGDRFGDYARARLRGMGSRLTTGRLHTCVIVTGGRVRCWGDNRESQLGEGTQSRTRPLTPPLVEGLRDTVAIAAAGSWTYALSAEGQVRYWGARTRTPTVIRGLEDTVAIAAGGQHSCALSAMGQVHCWGANRDGQLGDGTGSLRSPPVAVTRLGTTVAIAAGELHTCALSDEGQVRCWGANTHGQLGGSAPDWSPVPGLGYTLAIAAGGRHSCALGVNRQVRCWGDNSHGQLGDGTWNTRRSAVPLRVRGLGDTLSIAAGTSQTCAVSTRSEALCWGRNESGQLGDGTWTSRSAPTPVRGLEEVVAVAPSPEHRPSNSSARHGHTCALVADGRVYCWGNHRQRQCGYGTTCIAGRDRLLNEYCLRPTLVSFGPSPR